ncbi:MAG: tetratricopeptide repeat protein [Ginsengibacter sp.]
MKRCVLILFLFHFITHSNAQNAAIDSLNRLISKAQTDTERINLANKKIHILSEINIDSAITLGKAIIEEAKKIKYKKGEADALIHLAANFSVKGDYVSTQQSLKDAETICISLKDSSLFARLYGGYGMMYGIQSKYDTSIMYYEKSIGIDERFGNKRVLGSSYGNLAIGYQMQSNFPQALIYQQKSLRLAEELHDISGQAYTLMNMGNTYQNIGDTLSAEKAILKGIDLAKSIGIKNVVLYGYSNLASLYDLLDKFDKSYTYAMQAATLAKTMGDAGIQAASIAKAALALAKNKKYAEAENLNTNAISIADSSGQLFNIFQVYSIMGAILKLEGKYKKAIPFLEKSIHLLKDADRYDAPIAVAYADLSICYEKTGNYSKALTNYKTSAEIEDSVRSKENIRKATELSMNYDFEKRQTMADAIQGKKNAEARLQQILLLAGLGLTLIIAAGAWIAFHNKQKANRLLQQQKSAIQSTLTQLKATQTQLIQSEKMASLGELTAGIAHEIQNPLNFVNNFSEISTELIDEMEEEMNKGNTGEVKIIAENIKKNLEKINHHGRRAGAIVKGMLLHSRDSIGEKVPININALTEEYLRLSYHGLRARDNTFNVAMKKEFDESIGKINIIQQDIGRVLLNLFTNAFYAVNEKKNPTQHRQLAGNEDLHAAHRGYEPTVTVTTRKLSPAPAGGVENVEIRVRDNGMGIPRKVLDKIYQPFFTTKPTGQGTGLGLSISYDIIKAHGGELNVETEEGEFTEFTILLPCV